MANILAAGLGTALLKQEASILKTLGRLFADLLEHPLPFVPVLAECLSSAIQLVVSAGRLALRSSDTLLSLSWLFVKTQKFAPSYQRVLRRHCYAFCAMLSTAPPSAVVLQACGHEVVFMLPQSRAQKNEDLL